MPRLRVSPDSDSSSEQSVKTITMGNGSSSSSQQQKKSTDEDCVEHTYEEIEEQAKKSRFHRNCSIVTLDIKPGEWRRFAEAQRSKEEEVGAGGRDVWWGDEDQSSRRRVEGGWREAQGGWDTSSNAGWRDVGVGQWATYKRCVSLDVKQIDPDLEEKSDF